MDWVIFITLFAPIFFDRFMIDSVLDIRNSLRVSVLISSSLLLELLLCICSDCIGVGVIQGLGPRINYGSISTSFRKLSFDRISLFYTIFTLKYFEVEAIYSMLINYFFFFLLSPVSQSQV